MRPGAGGAGRRLTAGPSVVSLRRSFVSVNYRPRWPTRWRRRDVGQALAKDQDLVWLLFSIIVIAGGGRVATLGTGHRVTVPCRPTAAQAALSYGMGTAGEQPRLRRQEENDRLQRGPLW